MKTFIYSAKTGIARVIFFSNPYLMPLTSYFHLQYLQVATELAVISPSCRPTNPICAQSLD